MSSANRICDFYHSNAGAGPIVGLFDDAKNPRVTIQAAIAHATNYLSDDMKAHIYTGKQHMKKAVVKVSRLQLVRARSRDRDQIAIHRRLLTSVCLLFLFQAAIHSMAGMDNDRAMAIYLYTAESPLYSKLNDALRGEDRAILKAHLFPYLRILLEAFACFPRSSTPLTVNRGVKLDLVSMYPDEYAEENSFVWFALSSCTSNVKVLSNPMFLGTTGPRTIFQVTTRKAIDISVYSAIVSAASPNISCMNFKAIHIYHQKSFFLTLAQGKRDVAHVRYGVDGHWHFEAW